MKNIDGLMRTIREFKLILSDLKAKYRKIGAFLVFPSVKRLIEEMTEFEKDNFLSFLQNRSFSKLQAQVNQYIKDMRQQIKTLDVFLRNTTNYLQSKFNYNPIDVASEKRNGGNGTVDGYLDIYDVFLNVNHIDNPALLYETVLREKIKRKKRNIAKLNNDIKKAESENSVNKFINFLKKHDPYSKKIQIKPLYRSEKDIPKMGMDKEILFIGKSRKEQLIALINAKTEQMANCHKGRMSIKDLIAYFEYTALMIELLQLEKENAIQKLCKEEFYILKAKKFISILYEDNKVKNESLVKEMDGLKKGNIKLRVEIEKFRRELMMKMYA